MASRSLGHNREGREMKALPWGPFVCFHKDTTEPLSALEVPEGAAAATSI